MPDRIIRDELLTSERYWNVSDEAKLLYIHLLISADDTARYTGKNFSLRTRCFPSRAMESTRMETLLSELVDQDLIRLYEVDKERFVFIPRFKQRLRFVNSKYPEPPNQINDLVIEKTVLSQTKVTPKTDSSRQKRSEEKRSEEIRSKDITPDGVSPSVFKDYLAVRKAKKAPLTPTALEGLKLQAKKAGKTLEEVMRICCEKNWVGFNPEWLKTEVKTQDKPTIQWHQTLGGVMAKGKELGIEPKAGETEGQYRQRLIMAGA